MEHEIRTSLEGFTARVRAAIDAELDALAAELMQAVEGAETRARQAAESARATALTEARAAAAGLAAQQTAEASAAGRAAERDARLASVERLLASIRRLDAASSLRDTLEVLVQSASLETPRVAVLVIEGNAVRAFSSRGFDDVPVSGPLAPGGVIEACVVHGQPAFTSDAAGLKAPGFAGLAENRAGFAAPLRVGGRTVAVLYADDAAGTEREAPAAWPEALELLARHAALHLENLTALRAGGMQPSRAQPQDRGGDAEAPSAGAGDQDEAARRYARLLISEIKLYNESAVALGRERGDLGVRLREEIERARRTYRERIPETIAARDGYFETELLQTLAGGDPSLL